MQKLFEMYGVSYFSFVFGVSGQVLVNNEQFTVSVFDTAGEVIIILNFSFTVYTTI